MVSALFRKVLTIQMSKAKNKKERKNTKGGFAFDESLPQRVSITTTKIKGELNYGRFFIHFR